MKSKEVLTNKIALGALALLLAAVAVRKLHQWCFKHEASSTKANAADKPPPPPAPASKLPVLSAAELEKAEITRTSARYNDASNQLFTELTRRATHKGEQEFIEQITKDENLNTKELVNYINKQPWDHTHPLMKNPAHTQVALKAFREGKITDHQFATICIFASALKRHNETVNNRHEPLALIASVPLFCDDKTINLAAYKIIKASGGDQVTDSMIDRFFELMRLQPVSEQQFLIAEHSFYPVGSFNDMAGNILYTIQQRRAFELLISFANNGNLGYLPEQYTQIVASAGMFQAMLNATKKDKAVRINFVLGFSSDNDIRRNGLEDSRDMILPFEGIQIPTKFDGHKAWYLDGTFHDFYHAFICGRIYANHRHLHIKVSDHLSKKQSSSHHKDLAEEFVDMELDYYLTVKSHADPFAELKDDPDASYWANLFILTYQKNQLCTEIMDFLLISDKEIAESHQVSAKGFQTLYQTACDGIQQKRLPKVIDGDALSFRNNQRWGTIYHSIKEEYEERYGATPSKDS